MFARDIVGSTTPEGGPRRGRLGRAFEVAPALQQHEADGHRMQRTTTAAIRTRRLRRRVITLSRSSYVKQNMDRDVRQSSGHVSGRSPGRWRVLNACLARDRRPSRQRIDDAAKTIVPTNNDGFCSLTLIIKPICGCVYCESGFVARFQPG